MPWADLLRRVFREDLLDRPRCTGGMQVIATITDPAVVVAILTHVGALAEAPAVAPARAPPQVPLWPGGCDPPANLDACDPAQANALPIVFLRARARGWPPARPLPRQWTEVRTRAHVSSRPMPQQRSSPGPAPDPGARQTAFIGLVRIESDVGDNVLAVEAALDPPTPIAELPTATVAVGVAVGEVRFTAE